LHNRIDLTPLPWELANMADNLNGMLARIEDSFQRLEHFTGDIAHELRTPVHNLRGIAEVTLSQPRTEEQYHQALGGMMEETDRLTRLIDRLLLLARVSDPKMQLQREIIEPQAELREAIDFFEPIASQGQIALVLSADRPGQLLADRALFQRAISNILSNAIQHTPQGGRIEVQANDIGHEIIVSIRDTGVGIPQDELPHLFDRFYRSPQAKHQGRGVGIGLAIVKRVVELHNGWVEVTSEVNRGTTVTLHFPNQASI
jgi:two-component system heavy metal sensor histidine kinase CusS